MDDAERTGQTLELCSSALRLLERFPQIEQPDEMDAVGMVKAFEMCFELAWKCLKDVFTRAGVAGLLGPRPVLEKAVTEGLIGNSEVLSEMLKARNALVHTYDAETAQRQALSIRSHFLDELRQLEKQLLDQQGQP
jgi:nucleotidyltransferase substrate binding protein (TIGR01987 family)